MKRTIGIAILLLCCISTSADGESLGLKTVVIDPGHGGKDPGCVSKDNKTYEKNITLDIGKTLAERIREAYSDVKVVMTRETDVYVTLDERAAIANEADADLFISIHINANTSSAPSGYSVHVLGQSSNKNRDLFANNMDVCIRENSVIMLEDDYNTKYQGFDPANPESYIFMMLMQNAYLEQSLRFAEQVHSSLEGGPITKPRGMSQDPFYVLWKTSMPAVLLELGFMSNASDLEKLRDKSNRDELAGKIFKAFGSYKNVYDESINLAKYDDAPAPSTTATYYASTSSTSSSGISSSSSRTTHPPVLLPESTDDTASQSGTTPSSTTIANTSGANSASGSDAATIASSAPSSNTSSESGTTESSATSPTRIAATGSRTRTTTPPPVLLPESTEDTASQSDTTPNSTTIASTSEANSASGSDAATTASSAPSSGTSSESSTAESSATSPTRIAATGSRTRTTTPPPVLLPETTEDTASQSGTTPSSTTVASTSGANSASGSDAATTASSAPSSGTSSESDSVRTSSESVRIASNETNTAGTRTSRRIPFLFPDSSTSETATSSEQRLSPITDSSSESAADNNATETTSSTPKVSSESSTTESTAVKVVSETSNSSETIIPKVNVSETEIATADKTEEFGFSSATSEGSSSTYMGATLTPNESSATLSAPRTSSASSESTPTLSSVSRTHTREVQTSSAATKIDSNTTETDSPDTSESSNSSFMGSTFSPAPSDVTILTAPETVSGTTQTQITTESKSSSGYNESLWASSNSDTDKIRERISPPGAVSNASSARRSTSSTTSANRSQSQNSNWDSTEAESSDQAPVYYSSNTPASSSLLRARVGGNSTSSPVYLTPSMALNLEEVDEPETRQSEESIEQKPADRVIQTETRVAKIEYGIQIFATGKPQEDKSFFLGYTPKVIFDSGLGVYKHLIAISESKEKTRESLNEIRKKYPDAFLVEIRDGRITRVR